MTPPSATSRGMPPATSPPSSSTMITMAMGSAMASPRSRSDSEAVWKVSPTRTLPPTSTSGASSCRARSSTRCATASSSSSARLPARVTTTRAARPSVARSAVPAGPLFQGSATSRTPSTAAIRARSAVILAWTCGSATSMRSATMASWPPVPSRSSSWWATRPDSVEFPAPKSVDRTLNAELPAIAVPTRPTTQARMTARRRRTTKRPNRVMTLGRSTGSWLMVMMSAPHRSDGPVLVSGRWLACALTLR